MRRNVLLSLAIGLLLVSAASAEDWSKTFNVTGKPSLRVETSDASIHVSTWDQNTIQAHITAEGWKIGEGGLRIIDRQTGDAVEIEVRFPRNGFSFHMNRRVDIEIQMPREGRVKLHTGDGAIVLRDLKGDMELDSGDGHLDISSVAGSLKAHTGDGQIEADGRFDKLEVSTGDGRVEARALQGSTMGTGWELQSGDGSIRLAIPPDLAADVELQTGDGHITVDVPVLVEGHLKGNDIHGKLNGGGAPLAVHTGDGSIQLEKL
jgi:DUF4097 and DUF4098 domain-containing protein YvlB